MVIICGDTGLSQDRLSSVYWFFNNFLFFHTGLNTFPFVKCQTNEIKRTAIGISHTPHYGHYKSMRYCKYFTADFIEDVVLHLDFSGICISLLHITSCNDVIWQILINFYDIGQVSLNLRCIHIIYRY